MGEPNNPCFKPSSPYQTWTITTTTSTTTQSPDQDYFVIPTSGATCPSFTIDNQTDIIEYPSIPIEGKNIFVCYSEAYDPNPCILEADKYIRVADINVELNQCKRFKLTLSQVIGTTTTTSTSTTTSTTTTEQPLNQWVQIHGDIDGVSDYDLLGSNIDLNNAGDRIAISLPGYDLGASNDGIVRVYTNIYGGWIQSEDLFPTLSMPNGGSFTQVALNSAGNVLVIGSPYSNANGNTSGSIKIYSYGYFSGWINYFTLNGSNANDNLGQKVSINSIDFNGKFIALTTPAGGQYPNVKAYLLNPLQQWGDTLVLTGFNSGITTINMCGSKNGNRIAVSDSSISDPSIGQIGFGIVRVYELDQLNGNWTQIGSDILSTDYLARFGYSISLNDNGNIIAIGQPSFNRTGIGARVKVYAYDDYASSWVQLGYDISPGYLDDLAGWDVALNNNGDVLVVSCPGDPNYSPNLGRVIVYAWDGLQWNQLGQTIEADEVDEFDGQSVKINGAGNIIAISAPKASSSGRTQNGRVRIYQLQ